MKQLKNIALALVLVLSGILTLAIHGHTQAAGSGTVDLTLTSSSYTYKVGDSVTVDVYEDSGADQVSTLDANFTYPTNILSFVSITGGPAFDTDAQDCPNPSSTNPSCQALGTVKIGRGADVYPTGKKLVASVLFTVVGAGTANLNWDSSTVVNHPVAQGAPPSTPTAAQLNEQNATYTTTAPASGGGSSSGGGASSSGSSSSSSSKSSSNPTLTISGISVVKTATDATVTWKTSAAANSVVNYGSTTTLGFTVTDTAQTTSHSLQLNSKYLDAGKTYYFVVKSTDAKGNTATSPQMTFQMTPGTETPVSTNTTTNPTTTAKKKSNTTTAIIAVAAIALAAVAGAVVIRRMHRKALDERDLASHVAATTSPSTTAPTDTVITPQAKTSSGPTNDPKTK